MAGQPPTEEGREFIHQFAPGDRSSTLLREACDTAIRWPIGCGCEADRVVRGHGLKSQRDEKRKKIALAEVDLERWKADLAQAQANGTRSGKPSGIVPDVPEVMTGWLTQIKRLRDRVEDWRAPSRKVIILRALR